MAQKKLPFAGIRIVRRKSTALTRIVVATAVILSVAALLVLHGATVAARESTEELRQQAIVLEQERDRLEEYQQQRGTLQEILRIAQEKLGLTTPDSIIIQPK